MQKGRKRFWLNSVAQSCPILCDPMDCSMPGCPVHHQLPELAQTHVHRIGDAIHHLILCVPFSSCLQSPSIRVFSNESVLHTRWSEHWSFSLSIRPSNEHSGLIPLGWAGWISLQSKGFSKVFSNKQFKRINSSGLSFLYSPILTSIHDYWKNHSFD